MIIILLSNIYILRMFMKHNAHTIQILINNLNSYWAKHGCCIIPSYDLPIGAATSNIFNSLNLIKQSKLSFAYSQTCRRPGDSRYGLPTHKLQQYHQYQVIIKPIPSNIQEIYLKSLSVLGIDIQNNDLFFIEDNWHNPTLGASGIGWEIRLNSLEITQFTYFKKMCGLNCYPSAVEITYGIERISLILQNKNNVFDLIWYEDKFKSITYRDLFLDNEISKSKYNFEYADPRFLLLLFKSYFYEAIRLSKLQQNLLISAYEHIILAIYYFNLLESRKVLSHSLRQSFILQISKLLKEIASRYIKL